MSVGARQRILIISHDVVGSRMAGTGIRYWEIARVLAASHEVTLIAPRPIDLAPPGVTCGAYQWGDAASLEPWLATDLVVANGFALLAFPRLASIPQPLALDLYDPVLLENLELMRHRDDGERARQNAQDHALLQQQLAAGDFFLCATERQRDLLIGALMGAGRITHALTDHDPTLRRLIDVVPFGLSGVPPVHHAPALRGVVAGIGADDPILLWTGGLWDWMDPQTLVEALPGVVAKHPTARLVFLAGQHPGAIEPMRAPARARQRAADLHLLDTHVFFYDAWIPYEQRSSFLLEADIAVSLHHAHLETAYAAVRSRFLDHLWAGLPSVVADGDAAADLVRAASLGVVVPIADRAATAEAIISLLNDPARRRDYAANARRQAERFTWDRVIEPLARFCAAPQRTRPAIQPSEPSQSAPPAPMFQGVNATMQHEQDVLIKQLEGSWQFGTLPSSAGTLDRRLHQAVLRVLGPVVAQQRDFNAALVKLMYTLRASEDISTMLDAVMTQVTALEREVHTLAADIHARIDTVASFTGELSARLDVLERDLHGRLDTTADVLETIRRDANARLDTLGEFGGDLNDRLTRLVHATHLLDQAVAAGDDLDLALAEEIAALGRSTTTPNDADSAGGPA